MVLKFCEQEWLTIRRLSMVKNQSPVVIFLALCCNLECNLTFSNCFCMKASNIKIGRISQKSDWCYFKLVFGFILATLPGVYETFPVLVTWASAPIAEQGVECGAGYAYNKEFDVYMIWHVRSEIFSKNITSWARLIFDWVRVVDLTENNGYSALVGSATIWIWIIRWFWDFSRTSH